MMHWIHLQCKFSNTIQWIWRLSQRYKLMKIRRLKACVCVYELNGILWFITSITSMFVFIGHGQWCFNAITNRLSLLVFCLFVLFSFKMEKREEKTESTPSIQNGENSNAKCAPLTDHIKYSKIAFSMLQMNKHVMQRVDVHQKTVR